MKIAFRHLVLCSIPLMISAQAIAEDSAGAKVMNPDLSVDGLFSLSQFNRPDPLVFVGGHDPTQNGFNLQQVELTYGSSVDPYFRADANLVLREKIEVE